MGHRFRDFEHLLRLAGIFAAGILLFVVVRAELMPEDFGELGHYRTGAIAENERAPLKHAGQAACLECHGDVGETRAAGRHAQIRCESCHGPLAAHAASPDGPPPKPDARALCVRCHAANTGKPAWLPQVDVQEHAGDESCVSCHAPHQPRME